MKPYHKTLEFLTITIEDQCFDLPKDMPIPQKGDMVFIGSKTGTVSHTNYHITKGNVFMISIFTE